MKRRSTTAEDPAVDMAPMIDMVFLLLIFFMCASTLSNVDRMPAVELPIATHSEIPEDLAGRGTINVLDDGAIHLAGRPVTPAQLAEAMRERTAQTPDLAIYVRADRDLEHRHVKNVLRICAEAGVYNVIFAAYQAGAGGAP